MAISSENQRFIDIALVSFVDVAKELLPFSVPFSGLILVAWQIYQQATLRPRDLPSEVRDMLHRMRKDYERLLRSELNTQAKETVTVALRETFSILDKFGLSSEELVNKAELDPKQAAAQVLKQAASQLQQLDAPVRSLTERMIEGHYSIFLSHRDAINNIAVPALKELLRRIENLPSKLRSELEQDRQQEAWDALLPAVRTLSRPLSAENLLEALGAPYRLVEFAGQAHCALRDELSAALSGLAPDHSQAWVLWGPAAQGRPGWQ